MKKGFTLMEFLVVISIIAVLSTIGLITFQGTTTKTRDAVRKNDLNTLATALEIYFQKNQGKYILGSGSCQQDNANSTFYADIKQYIIGDVPKDPKTGDNYCYEVLNNGLNYALYAKLENCPAQDTIPGINCQTERYNFVKTPD